MSLQSIKATFSCDGCGRSFITRLDPADKVTNGWTLFEEAEDTIRAGFIHSYVDEPRSGPAETGMASIQSGQHLCPTCTKLVDDTVPEEREATLEEIHNTLNIIEQEAEDELP